MRNGRTGAVLKPSPIPERLLALMRGGGIFPLMEKEGLISAANTTGKREILVPGDSGRD